MNKNTEPNVSSTSTAGDNASRGFSNQQQKTTLTNNFTGRAWSIILTTETLQVGRKTHHLNTRQNKATVAIQVLLFFLQRRRPSGRLLAFSYTHTCDVAQCCLGSLKTRNQTELPGQSRLSLSRSRRNTNEREIETEREEREQRQMGPGRKNTEYRKQNTSQDKTNRKQLRFTQQQTKSLERADPAVGGGAGNQQRREN